MLISIYNKLKSKKIMKNTMLVIFALLLLSTLIFEIAILFPRQKENFFSQAKLIYTTSYFLSQKDNPSLIDVKTNAQYEGIIKKIYTINEEKELRFFLGDSKKRGARDFAFTLSIGSLSVSNKLGEKIDYQRLKIGDKIRVNTSLDYKELFFYSTIRKMN